MASGSIDWSTDLHTAGQVRPGLIWLDTIQGFPERSYNGSQGIDFGFADGTSTDPNIRTYTSCNGVSYCSYELPYYTNYLGRQNIPVLLGTDLTLFVKSFISDGAGPIDGLSTGSGSTLYQFHITEADGYTPVTFDDPVATPEPTTYELFGFGSLGLLALRRKRFGLFS